MSTSATEFEWQRSRLMGAMGLAELAIYYWLGERVCLRVIKAWQGKHDEARSAASARGVECASASRSESDLNL